jgi:hypothetical protein
MADDIPWSDNAVLVRQLGEGDREVVLEAPLLDVVREIGRLPESEREIFAISLPDRQTPPIDYGPGDFQLLIVTLALRERSRPSA